MVKVKLLRALILSGLAGCITTSALAEGTLPGSLTWTAYGTNTSGYAQSVAIGNMLKNNHGTTLSIKPGKNDVSRMLPLRLGKADYCACGVSSYFSTEGVGMFASKDWGPQNMRLILSSMGSAGTGVATAKDANIETAADLKGKRIPWVRGADALNVPMTGFLAFGGLTWNDVEKVEFSGFKDAWNALINGQSDAAFAITVTPLAKQLAASPNGIHWLPLPHEDKDGWSRLQTVAPYFVRHTATSGAGISADAPWEGAVYPYPVLIGSAERSSDEVYALVKAMDEGYADYMDAAPGAKGWALDKQNLTWVIPYHDGVVKYLKEKELWNEAAEAHNAALINRQDVIQTAWDAFTASGPQGDDAAFKAAWMEARNKALTEAGLNPVFN